MRGEFVESDGSLDSSGDANARASTDAGSTSAHAGSNPDANATPIPGAGTHIQRHLAGSDDNAFVLG